VIDVDVLAASFAFVHLREHEAIEKALDERPYEEIDEFRVIARDASTWEPIVTLLVALDRDHHALVRRVLERVCVVSSEMIDEAGGLHEALGASETLESDVGFDREQRREREGFVAPSAAASFLRFAGASTLEALVASRDPDAVTRAHFRAAPPNRVPASPPSPKVEAFVAHLRAACVFGARERRAPRLVRKGHKNMTILHRAMEALRADSRAFSRALDELAYLVNVLVAAAQVRLVEASDVAVAVCSLGLSMLAGRASRDDARLASLAKEHGLVNAFHVGWHRVGVEPWTRKSLRAAANRARRETSKA
jgi:hypothetical protein